MAIIFDDCDISENGTGVKAASNAEVTFIKTRIENNDIGVDIYISSDEIKSFGLPDSTDPQLVIDAINVLKDHSDAPADVKMYMLGRTKLFEWLGNISSITTIGTALIDYAKSL